MYLSLLEHTRCCIFNIDVAQSKELKNGNQKKCYSFYKTLNFFNELRTHKIYGFHCICRWWNLLAIMASFLMTWFLSKINTVYCCFHYCMKSKLDFSRPCRVNTTTPKEVWQTPGFVLEEPNLSRLIIDSYLTKSQYLDHYDIDGIRGSALRSCHIKRKTF